jgi:diguanylate cyclase (GGDEF)-like protein
MTPVVRTRIGVVMRHVVWVGLVTQLAFVGVLVWFSHTALAAVGAAGTLLWGLGVTASWRQWHSLAMWLVLAALLLHALSGVTLLGLGAAFQYYLFPLVPLLMFNERLRARTALAGGVMVLSVMLVLHNAAPDVATDSQAERLLTVMNVAASLLFLGLISYHFRMASMEVERKVATLAVTDPLTELSNRRHMEQRLREEESRAARTNSPFCLIMADIDHFKRVNDTHGHDTGDEVLVAAAEVFRSTLRAQDVIGRWGGEEFLLLLPNTTLDAGREVAERVRALAEAKLGQSAKIEKVTLTLGVARYESSIEACIKAADDALYVGKQGGRNRVAVYPAAAPAS